MLQNKLAGWVLFILILFSGYLISVYEGFSPFFVTILTAEVILVFLFHKSFSAINITLARTILALIFIFSGFVKGIDPVGTEYRIIDYFIAFGTDWASPLALPLSVILNAWEFILGALLLLNIRIKITSWLVLGTMVTFTLITINDATNNPVPDCGCFGDVLLISNWQTFYKNLVIDALLLIVFLYRKRNSAWIAPKVELSVSTLLLLAFVLFEIYNIRHLPVIDFRVWKTGNKMVHENPLPEQYFLTYKNKNTNEEKEYLSPDYPYSDSAWVANWEFVSQRVVDPNPPLHDLFITDELGADYTQSLIENSECQFLIIAYDLNKTSTKKVSDIKSFINECNNSGISCGLVTASLPEEAKNYLARHQLALEVYYADDIALMTMIRSNPGLVLFKDGVVLGKWHYNDWPEVKDIPGI